MEQYGTIVVFNRKSDQVRQEIPVDSNNFLFGKSDECDVRVKRSDVSDRQAQIVFENGKFFLENLSQTNPTVYNQKPIEGRVQIESNTVFEISGRSFKWVEKLVPVVATPKKVASTPKENVAANANKSASKPATTVSRTPFKAVKQSSAAAKPTFATPAPKSSASVALQRSASATESRIPKRVDSNLAKSSAVTPKKANSVPSAPTTPKISLMPSLTPKKVATPKVATPKVAAVSTPKSTVKVATVEKIATPVVSKTPVHLHFTSPAAGQVGAETEVSTPVKQLSFDDEESREQTQEASPSLNEEREEEEVASDVIPEEKPAQASSGRMSFTLLEDESDTIVVTPKKVAFASPAIKKTHQRANSLDRERESVKKDKQTAINAIATPAKKKTNKKKNVKKVPIAVTVARTPAKPSKPEPVVNRSEVSENGETFVVGVDGKDEETEEVVNEVEVLGLATPVKKVNSHKRFTTPVKDEISSLASKATESFSLSAATPRARSLKTFALPEPEAIEENVNHSSEETPKVARTPKTKEAVNDSEGNTFDFLSTKRSLFADEEEKSEEKTEEKEEEEEEEDDGFQSATEGESPVKAVEASLQSARVERSVGIVKNATPKAVKANLGSAKVEKSRGVVVRSGLATPQRREIQSKATAMNSNRVSLPSQKMGTPMRKAIQTAQLKPRVSTPVSTSARTTPRESVKSSTPVSTPLKAVVVENKEVEEEVQVTEEESEEKEAPVEEVVQAVSQVEDATQAYEVESEEEAAEESTEESAEESAEETAEAEVEKTEETVEVAAKEAEESAEESEEETVEEAVDEEAEESEAEETEEAEEMTAEQMNAHFEEIWEVLREEKDSEGERLSKKLLRLPSSKAKANKVYFEVVEDPIDLQMIKKSIGSGEYETVEAFRADFEKLFNNAILFNETKPCDENLANVQALQKLFEEQMEERFASSSQEEAEESEEEAEEETEAAEEESAEVEEAEEVESAEESEEEEEKVPTPQPEKRGRKKTIVQEAQMEESDEQVFSSPRTRRNNRKNQQQKSKLVEVEEEVVESAEGSGEEAEEERVEEAEEEEKESLEAAITRLSELRVVDLRAELKKKGLPTGGLKAELVRRLAEASVESQ
eukprot:TRINITY_DN2808_c0_g1_i1.p1 TRINITY_DN2808_c0_g1~~TRINITY_DN2808_c0_g1_i1.p1  ORF type:complete len:1116 (+),score=544.98 TRINITY_DN2808_c0_g1_i1:248-3595(+)